jgi:demethylspheroidene O-methyltransferase
MPLTTARQTSATEALKSRFDQWMTSPALYRWAIANPLGRWITRRRAAALFEVMAGFVHSQVLLACVRLGILDKVLAAPATLETLAADTGMQAASLERLLSSAVALRLLDQRSGGRYGLGALGAPVVTHAGLRAMIEHNALLYEDLRDPLALMQRPDQASMHAYWPYAADGKEAARGEDKARIAPAEAPPKDEPAEQVARYSELMSSSQRFVIEELLASYAFARHRRVLDVGGGQGGWVTELARHAPQLQLMLFDLPPVAAIARARIAQQGLTQRIEVHGGSFTADALPAGADLVTLLRVAHDHPDEVVRVLLRAIYEALEPGGKLLLAEPMAGSQAAPGAKPAVGDPYFHFYLLAMGSGRLRTAQALSALMAEAGFRGIKTIANPMPLHAGLIIGQKP